MSLSEYSEETSVWAYGLCIGCLCQWGNEPRVRANASLTQGKLPSSRPISELSALCRRQGDLLHLKIHIALLGSPFEAGRCRTTGEDVVLIKISPPSLPPSLIYILTT